MGMFSLLMLPITAIQAAAAWAKGDSTSPQTYPEPKPVYGPPPPGFLPAPQTYSPILYPGLPSNPAQNQVERTPWYKDSTTLVVGGLIFATLVGAFAFTSRSKS